MGSRISEDFTVTKLVQNKIEKEIGFSKAKLKYSDTGNENGGRLIRLQGKDEEGWTATLVEWEIEHFPANCGILMISCIEFEEGGYNIDFIDLVLDIVVGLARKMGFSLAIYTTAKYQSRLNEGMDRNKYYKELDRFINSNTETECRVFSMDLKNCKSLDKLITRFDNEEE